MPETQNGRTECKNESYVNYLSEELNHDSPENKVRIAVTLAHEFRRNTNSNTLTGETRSIILEDTKIIESFANAYGEGIYKKFPEYGILHYIKKIFGETELKEFADYAFDSTGSYWKVNEAGDLADDGKTSRVADSKGSELYSGTKGLQGTLQEWLGMENAYAALMQPAGFEWDGKQWSKNPGKIDHSIIEKAHNDGQLTDDQYNLIQLAAGKSAPEDDKSEKINLFKQFFNDYKQANVIKTQVQVDIANRAWEWIWKKLRFIKPKGSANNSSNEMNFENNKASKIVVVSELDKFIEIVRNTVGASYNHTRSPTETKMDCSGVFVYAMQQLGYKIDKHLTADRMASGQIPGIVLYEMVDNGRQGNKGVLNFYKWGTSNVQHVNYGVGKNEDETEFQIIDASEGDTWQSIRNNNEKQVKKAKKDTINQTWAPFSTKTKPDIQAYLDFSKFDKEIEIK